MKLPSNLEVKTKYERLMQIIEVRYPVGLFTSSEIQESYEDKFKEPIPLSTVSTYISRLVDKKIVVHDNSSSRRNYRLNRSVVVERNVR